MVNISLEDFKIAMQDELEDFIKDWIVRHQENPEQFPNEMFWDDWAENLSYFLQEKGLEVSW